MMRASQQPDRWTCRRLMDQDGVAPSKAPFGGHILRLFIGQDRLFFQHILCSHAPNQISQILASPPLDHIHRVIKVFVCT